jgi:hypothetical protein
MMVVAMAAKGHQCDTCTWILRLGTDVDQHNSGLLLRTLLLDAFARLTPEEFQGFHDKVISNGSKKNRSRFKQELKVAPQVGLPF